MVGTGVCCSSRCSSLITNSRLPSKPTWSRRPPRTRRRRRMRRRGIRDCCAGRIRRHRLHRWIRGYGGDEQRAEQSRAANGMEETPIRWTFDRWIHGSISTGNTSCTTPSPHPTQYYTQTPIYSSAPNPSCKNATLKKKFDIPLRTHAPPKADHQTKEAETDPLAIRPRP